ncbi:MAG: hypothetical protein AAFV29_11540, partial [Myxococcota bacterium]
ISDVERSMTPSASRNSSADGDAGVKDASKGHDARTTNIHDAHLSPDSSADTPFEVEMPMHGSPPLDALTQLRNGTLQLFICDQGSCTEGRSATAFRVARRGILTANHAFDRAGDVPTVFFRREQRAWIDAASDIAQIYHDDRPDIDLALIELKADADLSKYDFGPYTQLMLAEGTPSSSQQEVSLCSLGFPDAFVFEASPTPGDLGTC